MRSAALLAAAILTGCQSPADGPVLLTPSSPGAAECSALRPAIEERLAALLEEHGYPSIAVGIVAQGRPAYTVVKGVSDRETNRRATASTVYQIGSVTKMFVGLLAGRLAGKNSENLGRTLAQVFPDIVLPPDAGAITLLQLATHTAGVPRYPANLNRADGEPILGYSASAMRSALTQLHPEFPPGTAWSYSNFGYGILAEALAREMGLPLGELIKIHIAEPLGLTATGLELDDDMQTSLATPYRDDDPSTPTQPWDMGSLSGAGGVYASLTDLVHFAAMEIDPPAALRRAYEEAQELRWSFEEDRLHGYGLGRFLVESDLVGAYVVWHGGDVDGYASTLMAAPRERVAIVVLTNAGIGSPIGTFGNWLMREVVRSCQDG